MRPAIASLITACLLVAQDSPPKKSLDVPYVHTPNPVVEGMLKLAGVSKEDVVYDLGCGDGRIVIAAARIYGAHGVGIDIDPERVAEARGNAAKEGVERLVKFEEKDLFDADIHEATVVTLYLLPAVNRKLRPKLLKDLKPGTRIVSNSFDMGDWKPDKEDHVEGRHLYLWSVPAKP
ncbi:MAG TPA: methyltransferase domain-containing protein [Bryobacteraceae bacterium]|nr:methyltransferase domain-containing protein [Bryobacteraceae bacterium]